MGEKMTRSPKEMSAQETQECLAENFLHLAEYWREVNAEHEMTKPGAKTLAERVDGIGHSILTLMDGYSGAMCGLAYANKQKVDSGEKRKSSAARLDQGLLATMGKACGKEGLSELAIKFGSASGRLELIAEREQSMSVEVFEFMGRLRAAAIRWAAWGGDGREGLDAKACQGFAMSACALIEGKCEGFGGFAMAAMPHEEDQDIQKGLGEDWFPMLDDEDPLVESDLGGAARGEWSRSWGDAGPNASSLRAMMASHEEARELAQGLEQAERKLAPGFRI